MKPNFPLSSEVILTLIAIFLLGIAVLVSIVFLAFMFSGNASEFTLPHLPTKLVSTRKYATPSQGNATKTPTSLPPTTVVSPEQGILSPTPGNISQNSEVTVPTPDYSETLAEIGVLDTSRSASGTSVIIEISVYNFGTIPFTLSESNVTLTQPDGKTLALEGSSPELPQEIPPGETRTIELEFEMPSSRTATLKILTVEYDVEGY